MARRTARSQAENWANYVRAMQSCIVGLPEIEYLADCVAAYVDEMADAEHVDWVDLVDTAVDHLDDAGVRQGRAADIGYMPSLRALAERVAQSLDLDL